MIIRKTVFHLGCLSAGLVPVGPGLYIGSNFSLSLLRAILASFCDSLVSVATLRMQLWRGSQPKVDAICSEQKTCAIPHAVYKHYLQRHL